MSKRTKYDTNGEVIELGDDFFDKARPVSEVFPKIVKVQKEGKLVLRPRGRPKAEITKISTTLRLDAKIIDYFKRDGRGWQTGLNNVLKEYVERQ